MKTKSFSEYKWHVLLVLIILLQIVPIIFMTTTSFKTMDQVFNGSLNLLPEKPTLENYQFLFNNVPIMQYIKNTFVIAITITLSKLFTGLLAAYFFVYFDFKWKHTVYFLLIASIFVPFTVTVIPNYLTISQLGLMDNPIGDDAHYMNTVRKFLEGQNKKINLSIHGPFKNINLIADRDTLEYKNSIESYKYTLEFAHQYNGSYIVIHTNEIKIDPLQKSDLQDRAVESIYDIISLSKHSNTKLAIENVGLIPRNNLLFNLDEYIKIFQQIEEIYALIDVGHLHVNHWDLNTVISSLNHKIIGYHLHDNHQLLDEHLRIGEGTFDWISFFEKYLELTPCAQLVLEYEPSEEVNIDGIKNDIGTVLSFLDHSKAQAF